MSLYFTFSCIIDLEIRSYKYIISKNIIIQKHIMCTYIDMRKRKSYVHEKGKYAI